MEETTAPVIHRRVLKFALPILLSNAIEPILGAADTGVVGLMGQAALIGAAGIGTVILSTINWVFCFLRMGTTEAAVQAHGAGDTVETGPFLMWTTVTQLFTDTPVSGEF